MDVYVSVVGGIGTEHDAILIEKTLTNSSDRGPSFKMAELPRVGDILEWTSRDGDVRVMFSARVKRRVFEIDGDGTMDYRVDVELIDTDYGDEHPFSREGT